MPLSGVTYLFIFCWQLASTFHFACVFFQVRMLREMLRVMFAGEKSKAGISSFQALAVSLSGRVGTGNIAGVATAIFIGGPGAVFWMWLTAFLGAGSAFIESTLAQIYKKNVNGLYRGGPAFYIEKGIRNKKIARYYAIAFAVATILATGFLLPGVQANSIASGFSNAFRLSHFSTGLILVVLLGAIIFGGIKTIARVAEYVVPVMAIAYILVAMVILLINYAEIPRVLSLIFTSAFGAQAAFGGIVGAMISIGVKRGVYSNEAGQGTGPHPAAAAEVSHPAKQGQGFCRRIGNGYPHCIITVAIKITYQFKAQYLYLPRANTPPVTFFRQQLTGQPECLKCSTLPRRVFTGNHICDTNKQNVIGKEDQPGC